MKRSLFLLLCIVLLDAIGIGLIFPILPKLLQNLHLSYVSVYLGVLVSLYALMQFLFSPVIGSLSDRFGRRPILLLSLFGTCINYLCLAVSHSLFILILGRIIAGITSANMSVISAYMIDTVKVQKRAQYFGLISATFGIGFIVGPVLGGILGDYWVRLPFLVAFALTAISFLAVLIGLPEPHQYQNKERLSGSINPLAFLREKDNFKKMLPFLVVFSIFSTAGEAYAVCWALWGQDTFLWNSVWIGLSLGIFGLCQTLVQILLPNRAIRWLGIRKTVLLGIGCSCFALCIMAFSHKAWIIFMVIPVFSLGSIGVPALQMFASQQVEDHHQGKLQGLIASSISLSAIFAPLFFSFIYSEFSHQWTGAVWIVVAFIYLLMVPLIFKLTQVKQTLSDNF